jgi:hypothetical protein
MNKLAYLNAMLKKSIILFNNNGFDLSGIKKDLNLRCLDIKQDWDGYHQLTQNNNFDLNKENNYRYYPNRNIHKIVIDSKIDNGIQATETLIHELCHAVQYDLHGEDCSFHGKEFKAIASSVGLDASKPKTTPALPALETKIQEWGREIGPYPHTVPMPKETKILEVIGELVLNLLFFATFLFIIGGSVYLIILTAYEYFLI